MEVERVNDCVILVKDFPLKQRALHAVAKNVWNNLLIKEKECVFIIRDTEKWIIHREKVINNLPQILKELPIPLRKMLIGAIFSLQEGYSEAVSWEERCESALNFSIFDPMAAGEYQIDNFLDPSGYFKELNWAKRFVDDENKCIRCRFVLACYYCFDKTIEYLWRTMKTSGQLPCNGYLLHIKFKYNKDDLIVIWSYQLENKFYELIEDDDYYADGFYSSGLKEAILKGHEYAARFFWNRCSDDVKNNFFDIPAFDNLINAAKNNHAGLVNFIYSLLNEEQKERLISYTIEDGISPSSTPSAPILSCLLQSRYYESVLNDIKNSPFPITTEMYRRILISLSSAIAEVQIPLHEIIFEELWKNLPQAKRKEVLEEESIMIINLVRVKAMELLKIIIEPLSLSEKDRMLLNDWQQAGISAFDLFSYRRDYDELGSYLFIFLMDYCPETQKTSLRSDAPTLFEKFIKSEKFINFFKLIPDSEKENLNKFIQEFQGRLEVPHELPEKAEEN